MNELALFAGAGGGILGGKLLGWRTVCAVEFDPYARRVLLSRQADGCLDKFPIWDDVRTFDGKLWRGHVDVVSGGFPCQDISAAGKGEGITGERSGLWGEMARIIGEVRPRFAFVENSPVLTSRGLGTVLGDLAAMGYDARWGVLGAIHAGAPHKRDRIWIIAELPHSLRAECESWTGRRGVWQSNQELADSQRVRRRKSASHTHPQGQPLRQAEWQKGSTRIRSSGEDVADATDLNGSRCADRSRQIESRGSDQRNGGHESFWATEPDVGRVADGVAARVDRLRCLGNGQVPAVAALAWRILSTPTGAGADEGGSGGATSP